MIIRDIHHEIVMLLYWINDNQYRVSQVHEYNPCKQHKLVWTLMYE